jgi:vacuolar-type H+-ATPase subunit H
LLNLRIIGIIGKETSYFDAETNWIRRYTFENNYEMVGGNMSIAILREITSAEEEAEQIEAQAQQKARQIVASAKKDASFMIEKAVEQAELDGKKIIKAAEDKAARDMNDMNVKIQAQCDGIKENSGSKLKDAVDFIVGRIVKHSDS